MILDEFSQSCLKLIKSELVSQNEHVEDIKKSVPTEKSIKTIVSFINENCSSEKLMQTASDNLISCNLNLFDLSIEENQQCLYMLMKIHSNNINIIKNVLEILEKALATIVDDNLMLINNDDATKTQPTVNLSSQFLEKYFQLFLVSIFTRLSYQFSRK